MDRDAQAALHRKKLGRNDRVTKIGRIEDLVRQFKSVASSKQMEYFISVGGTEYGPHQIESLASELGIDD